MVAFCYRNKIKKNIINYARGFMLDYTSGEQFYGEYNDNTIKQSRKTRSQKIGNQTILPQKNLNQLLIMKNKKF